MPANFDLVPGGKIPWAPTDEGPSLRGTCETGEGLVAMSSALDLPPRFLKQDASIFEGPSSETALRFPPGAVLAPVGMLCQAESFESPRHTTTECPGLWQ